MCVRSALFLVCDVRSQFCTFWGKKGQFWTFFGNKRLISMLFSWSYFTLIPYEIKKCIKKSKICYKITHLLQTCACVCNSNFGKMHTCVRPKIECANVRACEAKNRRNSQFALFQNHNISLKII